jgi:hypothetical protein
MKLYENFRIEPLMSLSNTAASTTIRKTKWNDEDRMLFVCKFGGASPGGTAMSCTEVNVAQFALMEATASTSNGSLITGGTMSLGPTTAYQVNGGAVALTITLTSAVTTAMNLHLNGIIYHTTLTGPGGAGEDVATQLAAIINGKGTWTPLPNYVAVPNFGTTGIVGIFPSNPYGTGLSCTAAATDYKPRSLGFVGAIELNAYSLSTVYPKFVGCVMTTYAGASALRSVDVIRVPNPKPGFSGKTVSTT